MPTGPTTTPTSASRRAGAVACSAAVGRSRSSPWRCPARRPAGSTTCAPPRKNARRSVRALPWARHVPARAVGGHPVPMMLTTMTRFRLARPRRGRRPGRPPRRRSAAIVRQAGRPGPASMSPAPGRRRPVNRCPVNRCPVSRCPVSRCLVRRCLVGRCLVGRFLVRGCLVRRRLGMVAVRPRPAVRMPPLITVSPAFVAASPAGGVRLCLAPTRPTPRHPVTAAGRSIPVSSAAGLIGRRPAPFRRSARPPRCPRRVTRPRFRWSCRRRRPAPDRTAREQCVRAQFARE